MCAVVVVVVVVAVVVVVVVSSTMAKVVSEERMAELVAEYEVREGNKNKQKMKNLTGNLGNIGKKVKLLRKSKNLRFKKLYHPPDPLVLGIFVSICIFFIVFFNFYMPEAPKYNFKDGKAIPHSEL